MISGSAKLTNRFALGTAFILDHLGRTVAATGRDIAQTTRDNMTPHHFYDSGLSQETTVYSPTGPRSGAVQVPTDYAAFAELGTSNMAPRPALTPAIQTDWPNALHHNWDDPDLPAVGEITGLVPPVSKP